MFQADAGGDMDLNRLSAVLNTQLRPLLKVHSPVPASLSSGRKKNHNSLVSVATAVLAHPALKAPVRTAVR